MNVIPLEDLAQSAGQQLVANSSEATTVVGHPDDTLGVDFRLVGRLNNLGVCFLEFGDLATAFSTIRDALKYSMGGLPFIEAAHLYEEVRVRHHAMLERNNGTSFTENLRHHSASAPFMHAKGLSIIPSPTAYSTDALVSTTVSSSILLFNLALAYHLRAIQYPQSSYARLQKAVSLYQKSVYLLNSVGVRDSSTGNPVIDLLLLATFNNLAHTRYEMGAYADVRPWFDRMIQFSTTILPSSYNDSYMAAVIDQEKSNFLLNAIILSTPKYAAAA